MGLLNDQDSLSRDANKENRDPADMVIPLLRRVLTCFRDQQAVVNRADLREVDDLCFDIRVAAQNATVREENIE